MTDKLDRQKVMNMLNREVIQNIEDTATKRILKNILFSPCNDDYINWDEAYEEIIRWKPELVKYDGYKRENMMKEVRNV